MTERPANLEYSVADRPPWVQVVLLGIQFAVIISVYLVMIVIVVRAAGAQADVATSAVSFGMIAIAIATVLQALPHGPVGSGFMAPPVFSAIYLGPSILAAQAGGLPAVFAMTIFAGLVEIIASRFLDRLRILIQPTVSGLVICAIGLELGIVGMQQALDIRHIDNPQLPFHVMAGAVTLAVALGLTVWSRGVWRLIASLLGMLAGMLAALMAGVYEPGAAGKLAATAWFAVPGISHISYSFEPALIPAFLAGGLAATLRTVGVVTTCQRINDAEWKQPDYQNIKRGVLADGLGCMIGGFLGTPGMNIAPSLVGVSVAAGVTSRVVAYAAAAALVLLAFLPKVAMVFLILPMPIAGAILIFTASLMFAAGLLLVTSKPLDTRAKLVIGIAILIGLVHKVNPGFFERLPEWLHLVSNSSLSLSLITAIMLTLLFELGRREEEVVAWRESDKAIEQLKADLGKHAQDWALKPETIDRIADNVANALRLLKEGSMLRKPLSITLSKSRAEVEVELRYEGLPLAVPDVNAKPAAEQHEEMSAIDGLQHASVAVHADGARTTTSGDRVKLRLTFKT